ncbi:MAG: dolichol-phosphate mannosyltransferase, partial [Thermomicrobiales bacterium]|nr:dolichol-phosphate mannosyltransferase [Thermomicrobiales bacterium]
RPPGARGGGLGGAVVHGLREARAEWVCVMDADLQHPPEVVPRLLDQVRDRQDDLVIASRYCESGTVGSFGRTRATFSRGSTLAARAAFPDRLRGVTDPMSGFFLIRRSAIDAEALQPTGFKILLEILARSRRLRVSEVPFEFGTRHAGHSKASAREGLRYVRQLAGLRLNDDALRFLKFGLVGASGLLVNSLLLAFNAGVLGLFYLIAALLATQGSTAWNFALTERLVFLSGRRSEGRRRRCVLFFAMNNVAFGLRGPMMFVLTSALGMHYLWSNIVSMLALMILRYTTADRWIWGSAQPPLTVPAYPVVSPAVKVGEGA